jgi:fructan beta-fructosidase
MKQSRTITVQHPYLNLPVKNGGAKYTMRFLVRGSTVRSFDIELAPGRPDFWVFADLTDFVGQELTIEVEGEDLVPSSLDALYQDDEIAGAADLYREAYRPQFHFSSRRGWNNDPNGLIYYQGQYHLFYQHNPYGWSWGNMHWGHAVSGDLVHWQEWGDALYPDELGTVFSGSGVVDWQNTAGFQRGADPALICIYTSAGEPFTQSIAYSNDRGRTWTPYEGNPVLGHVAGRNRDPKVIWHAPTGKWVMALYLDGNDYALFASPDLKAWARLCDVQLPGASECPDFFELPVDGDPANTRWVFWGANGTYALGSFDGHVFAPEGEVQHYDWGGSSYAAQTWSDIPARDGRRIQIAWLRADMPGMPFNQCMTFPCELTLRTTPEGVRLFSQPVQEVEILHGDRYAWQGEALRPEENLLSGLAGDLWDIRAEVGAGSAAAFGFAIRGVPVVYDVGQNALSCQDAKAPLEPVGGTIRLQILVDRASIEVFGNDGRVALPVAVIPAQDDTALEIFARGGPIELRSLEVYALRGAWAGRRT